MEEKILERVRKLLAKAESCASFGTPEGDNEAKVLTGKAQEMIAEYAISEAMLKDAGKTRGDVEVREILVQRPFSRDKATLLNVVAKANRVRIVVERVQNAAIKATAVGFDTDLDATELLYTSLLMQMTTETLATPVPDPRTIESFRRSFMMGYTQRISQRLQEAAAKAEATVQGQQTGGASVALVLADRKSLVDQKISDLFPHLQKSRRAQARSYAGFHAGQQAANRANLGQSGLGSRRAIGA